MIQPLTTLALAHEASARVLQRYQIAAAEVFAAAGIDPEPFRNPDARISTVKLQRFWNECVRRTNPCIGFEIGEALSPANLHAVGYAWLSSRTLREALDRLVRYQRILTTSGRFELEETGEHTLLTLQGVTEEMREGADMSLTGVITICRETATEDFAPAYVAMTRSAPPCAAHLRRFFSCPVRYGEPRNLIAFRSTQISRPLMRQVPALAMAMDGVARAYLADMDRDDIIARGTRALIDSLPDGEPSRPALAARLHLSDKSLARRLAEAGTSYRALLDTTRKDLAVLHLQDARHSVSDVTYLLGFSDQSNFARSFKRWTGTSPSAYRAQLGQA